MLMDETGKKPRDNSVAIGISRGVARLMRSMDADCLFEFKLRTGRRADVIGLDRKGCFIIIEIKSSVADYRSDGKWHEYIGFCDHFYFAVPPGFPIEILPDGCGIIFGDSFGAEISRPSAPLAMNASRRRALTLLFARTAATRLIRITDRTIS